MASSSEVVYCGLDRGHTLQFTYTNWRGDEHVYVIAVEGFAVGPYDAPLTVVLHGEVITRDGDRRADMGGNRRRTFLVSGIREMQVPS